MVINRLIRLNTFTLFGWANQPAPAAAAAGRSPHKSTVGTVQPAPTADWPSRTPPLGNTTSWQIHSAFQSWACSLVISVCVYLLVWNIEKFYGLIERHTASPMERYPQKKIILFSNV